MGKAPVFSILISLLICASAPADLVTDLLGANPRSQRISPIAMLSHDTLHSVTFSASCCIQIATWQAQLLDAVSVASNLPQAHVHGPDLHLRQLVVDRLAHSLVQPGTDGTLNAPSTAGETVIELPPPPDSSILTLSGLLTLAGMHLVRSARHAGLVTRIHAAHTADWYHAGATQLAHSVPFDFASALQPMQSAFDLITPEPDRAGLRFHREAESRRRSLQHTLLVLAPRSPPLTQS